MNEKEGDMIDFTIGPVDSRSFAISGIEGKKLPDTNTSSRLLKLTPHSPHERPYVETSHTMTPKTV
jgi:hypothetical protein